MQQETNFQQEVAGKVPLSARASCLLPLFQQVQAQNLSYENEFDLHFSGLVRKNDYHMKGFALGLVLKQR